ncbi:hypothetical protein BG004_006022 [Podila humilis]|nr:hypothetical protein BG004_006022 [Podila humilis]
MLDILMAYRLTGMTIFTEEEHDEHLSQLELSGENNDGLHNSSRPPSKRKQIGIRIDTFALARYFEPYYIMLSIQDRKKNNEALDTNATLEITKHTIPHWIPLRDFATRYLNRDMKTFTQRVSEYLQAFVVRRENISKILKDFSSAAESLPKEEKDPLNTTTSSTVQQQQQQQQQQRPNIIVQSKDAAIQDVVLYITHFNILFKLYNRQVIKQRRQEAKTKLALAPTTITSSGLSRLLSDHNLMDMDIDDNDSETNNAHSNNADLLQELTSSEEIHSVQIRLVYEDLTTTRPTKAYIRFRGSYESEVSVDLWRTPLLPEWKRVLLEESSLAEAFASIARSIKD